MININNLQFNYGRNVLFEGLELELEKGNIYGLLGMNGAGKTTLLRLMTGLQFPNQGSVDIAGYIPSKRDPDFLAKIFMLSEDSYVPSVSMKEYLSTHTAFYPKFSQQQFDTYLSDFDVPQDTMLNKLSYGQKKKFFISLGLASQTDIVIMDEPTNGLDIPSKAIFRSIMAGALNEDRIFIISSHQVRDLNPLINGITVLHNGRILLSQFLDTISDTLHLVTTTLEPQQNQPGFIYSEKVVGGYSTLWAGENKDNEALDIEILFNAIIKNSARINECLNNEGGNNE